MRAKAIVGSATFGFVLAAVGCNRAPTTVDEVIDRNVQAMGGRTAIEAIQSIEVRLHISDPGFDADAIYYAARPGKMRIDVSVAGNMFSQKRSTDNLVGNGTAKSLKQHRL